jgi:signal recognition particle GTPase
MKEHIEKLIEWADIRLTMVDKPLTKKQKDYVVFSLMYGDLIEKKEIRNKMSPIKNLIAMLENENISVEDNEINKLIKKEIDNVKLIINYITS